MRRFRFRLARVLRVRRLEEEVARGRLLDADARARTARASALEAAQVEARGLVELRERLGAPRLEPAALLVRQDAQDTLGALRSAREALARAREREVEHRREAALAARSAVRGLERLEERRRGAHAVEAERVERLALEELARRPGGGPASGRPALAGRALPGAGSSRAAPPADHPSRAVPASRRHGRLPHDPA